jgi:hypothetical protein
MSDDAPAGRQVLATYGELVREIEALRDQRDQQRERAERLERELDTAIFERDDARGLCVETDNMLTVAQRELQAANALLNAASAYLTERVCTPLSALSAPERVTSLALREQIAAHLRGETPADTTTRSAALVIGSVEIDHEKQEVRYRDARGQLLPRETSAADTTTRSTP